MADDAPLRISRVVGAGQHPRRAGFRDGIVAAAIVVAVAIAAGRLSIDGGTSGIAGLASSGGPPGPGGSPAGLAAGGRPTPGDGGSGGAAPAASLPTIPALTLIYLPTNRTPAGTDMVDGCGFLFDFGIDGGGRRYRSCPGAEGPTGPLGILHADPGAVLYVENSGFTPSVDPALPAVACGHLTGQPPAFVADSSCRPSYAASSNHEYGFRLPETAGRWVIAIRGCVAWAVITCGAWYAEVETAAASPRA